jgi:WD40 repeat protein/tRNA A-37 threonylcarbamoyl transferase component Bud32
MGEHASQTRLPLDLLRQIDALCARFETALRDRHRLEPALLVEQVAPVGRSALVRELLLLELEACPSAERPALLLRWQKHFPEYYQAITAAQAIKAELGKIRSRSKHMRAPVTLPGQEPNADAKTRPAETGRSKDSEAEPGPPAGPYGEPDALLATGSDRQFGDYELLEEIGHGGMGVVYKARQRSLGRLVALKTILRAELATPGEIQRFHREAEAAAQLDHPGIVPVFDVGEWHGQHYFSMALVDGPPLSRQLRAGPLPAAEAAQLVQKLALAIQAAHDQGIVHRDLKPENVLLDHGQPRITDFGLAKQTRGSDLTATGQVLGTPSYMAPEQARGKAGTVGPATDIYALGAVLYACLTGRPPFQAATTYETMRQVVENPPASVRALNPSVPRDLEIVCLKCLAKKPHERYPTALDLAQDLNCWLHGEPITARPTPLWRRALMWCRRHEVITASAAVTTAALFVFAFQLLYYYQEVARHNQLLAKERSLVEPERARLAKLERRSQIDYCEQQRRQGRELCEPGKDVCQGLMRLATAFRLADELEEVPLKVSIRRDIAEGTRQLICRRSGGFDEEMQRSRQYKIVNDAAQLYDVDTGQPRGKAIRHAAPIVDVAFSLDGRHVATLSKEGCLRLSDSQTGLPLGPDIAVKAGKDLRCGFTADARTIVCASNSEVSLYDAQTGHALGKPAPIVGIDRLALMRRCERGDLDLHQSDLKSLLSTNGRIAVVCGAGEQFASVWAVAKGEKIGATPPHVSRITTLAIDPTGQWGASGSWDGQVNVWHLATGFAYGSSLLHGSPIRALAFSPNGRRLLIAGKVAQLWDPATGQRVGQVLPVPEPSDERDWRACRFSTSGRIVLLIDDRKSVFCYDVGLVAPTLMTSSDKDALILATACQRHIMPAGHTLQTPDLRLTEENRPRGPQPVASLPFKTGGQARSPQAGLGITPDGRGELWDVTGKLVMAPCQPDSPLARAWLAYDGKEVIAEGDDGLARRWLTPTAVPENSEMLVTWIEAMTGSTWDPGKPFSMPLEEAKWQAMRIRGFSGKDGPP